MLKKLNAEYLGNKSQINHVKGKYVYQSNKVYGTNSKLYSQLCNIKTEVRILRSISINMCPKKQIEVPLRCVHSKGPG